MFLQNSNFNFQKNINQEDYYIAIPVHSRNWNIGHDVSKKKVRTGNAKEWGRRLFAFAFASLKFKRFSKWIQVVYRNYIRRSIDDNLYFKGSSIFLNKSLNGVFSIFERTFQLNLIFSIVILRIYCVAYDLYLADFKWRFSISSNLELKVIPT